MANRSFDTSYVLGKSRVVLGGSFNCNGAGAPSGQKGKGWSVARTATGTYTILFQDAFVDYDAAGCDLAMPTTAGAYGVLDAIDVVNAKTLIVKTVNAAGTPVDIAAGAGCRVHFSITLVNTTIP